MGNRPMLAVTIHQPYAWSIVHGYKPVENRSWSPRRDIVGGWLLIHAGKRVAEEDAYAAARWVVREAGGDMPSADKMVLGALVGAARVTRVISLADYDSQMGESLWATGPICWCLADAIAFREPIPCRGAQGIWDVPEVLRAAVREQWRRAA